MPINHHAVTCNSRIKQTNPSLTDALAAAANALGLLRSALSSFHDRPNALHHALWNFILDRCTKRSIDGTKNKSLSCKSLFAEGTGIEMLASNTRWVSPGCRYLPHALSKGVAVHLSPPSSIKGC